MRVVSVNGRSFAINYDTAAAAAPSQVARVMAVCIPTLARP